MPEDPAPGEHPNEDRDELHDIYRGWRAIADSYPGTRVLVGEIWLPDIERFAMYLRPDELHTAFNFDFLARPWNAVELRTSIDATLAAHAPVDAPSTWVLSNHDVTRPVTRYGREDSSFAFAKKRVGTPTDLDGRTAPCARCRAAHRSSPRLALHLSGRRAGAARGRGPPRRPARRPDALPLRRSRPGDATAAAFRCRGAASTPPFGFSPSRRGRRAVAAPAGQLGAPHGRSRSRATRRRCCGSTGRRSASAALRQTSATAPSSGGMPRKARSSSPAATRFLTVTNLSHQAIALPEHIAILLSSSPLDHGLLPPDSTAWLRTQH